MSTKWMNIAIEIFKNKTNLNSKIFIYIENYSDKNIYIKVIVKSTRISISLKII